MDNYDLWRTGYSDDCGGMYAPEDPYEGFVDPKEIDAHAEFVVGIAEELQKPHPNKEILEHCLEELAYFFNIDLSKEVAND